MTILSFLEELNSFVDCSKYFYDAERSDITSDNNSTLRCLVQEWGNGLYDEDVEQLLDEVIHILKTQ